MSIRVYIKIFRVSMVASGIVTNTFENVSKTNWIFQGRIYTIFWSLNFWKSPFHSRIKDHEDGNMLDNFYNNKLIDLNFKTKSLYLLSDIENFFKKNALLFELPPLIFRRTRTNENPLISTWRTFGVAKVKHLVKMSL